MDKNFVSFGDVCLDRLGMQCQYGSRYVDRSEQQRGGAYLGRNLRITGLDGDGRVNDYHRLCIHKDDVEEFVRRVAMHKVVVGAWAASDVRIPDMSQETRSYLCGTILAWQWIDQGGSLDADGPETRDEAYFNGFIDTLAAEARLRRKAARSRMSKSETQTS